MVCKNALEDDSGIRKFVINSAISSEQRKEKDIYERRANGSDLKIWLIEGNVIHIIIPFCSKEINFWAIITLKQRVLFMMEQSAVRNADFSNEALPVSLLCSPKTWLKWLLWSCISVELNLIVKKKHLFLSDNLIRSHWLLFLRTLFLCIIQMFRQSLWFNKKSEFPREISGVSYHWITALKQSCTLRPRGPKLPMLGNFSVSVWHLHQNMLKPITLNYSKTWKLGFSSQRKFPVCDFYFYFLFFLTFTSKICISI